MVRTPSIRLRAASLALVLAGCAARAAPAIDDAPSDATLDAARDAALGDEVLPDASACAALIAACQAPSVVSTQAAWCHLLGHAGDEASCQSSFSACLATCAADAGIADAADAGPEVADAPESAPADAADAPATCASYCACMKQQCASFPSYPFADDAACLAKCGALAPAELACFAYFCDDSKRWSVYPTLVQHECDHALGAYGVSECPAP